MKKGNRKELGLDAMPTHCPILAKLAGPMFTPSWVPCVSFHDPEGEETG